MHFIKDWAYYNNTNSTITDFCALILFIRSFLHRLFMYYMGMPSNWPIVVSVAIWMHQIKECNLSVHVAYWSSAFHTCTSQCKSRLGVIMFHT